MTPRFSIVVPTCDRGHLLQHTLRALLSIERDDVEFIVSDNFSSDDTDAIIRSFAHDTRLKALRTSQRMAMPSHWDFALSHARGTFVIVNGDDDLFLPELLSRIDRIVEKLDPKLLTWRIGLYHHPDYDAEKSPNSLHFLAGHSGLALVLDPKKVVAAYAKFRFEFFPEGTRFCFRRDMAKKIIDKTGRFFWPSSPDFSAPMLCLLECRQESNDYVFIDALMGFGGRSRHSNGASSVKGAENQRVRDYVAEFAGEDVLPFNPLKAPFFLNYHATHFYLAKQFYSEAMAGVFLDDRVLFNSFYEEIYGLRYNPLFSGNVAIAVEAESALDLFLRECTPNVQAIAQETKKAVAHAADRSRDPSRRSGIQRIVPFVPFRNLLKKMILSVGFADHTAEPEQQMVSVPGSDHFANGFDLIRYFDSAVNPHDHLTLLTVERAVEQGVLFAAHKV